jgi:RNA polymerase-binding transcription factor
MLDGQEWTMTNTAVRTAALREMLIERRREVQAQVHGRIRNGRAGRSIGVGDTLDQSDAHIQGDVDLTLLQMQAENLGRIDAALVRLEAGTYGRCFECDRDIAGRRLRALPFAVRCQACQQRREHAQGHVERLALRRGRLSLFSDAVSPEVVSS